jgi:oxygen-independent coproporphyrinogen-3 oxidase
MDADIEITLEANPGSVESENFASYAASGVNRISLGIQSFNDQHLSALGRIHRSDEAKRAILLAQQYFPKVNIDLMYALPGQTIDEALADLQEALSFETGHISLYHLTIEPNTYFAKFPPSIPDEDTAYDMQDNLLDALQNAGYERYEISAFAKPGARCQHNLNYWAFGDYLGIGAGAHGKISSAAQILRTVKERHPETYLKSIYSPSKALIEERVVQGSELPFEFMLNALRLIDGVPSHYFNDRTGVEMTNLMSAINLAIEKGLMDSNINQLKATPLGLQFLNDLQEIFLDEPDLEN